MPFFKRMRLFVLLSVLYVGFAVRNVIDSFVAKSWTRLYKLDLEAFVAVWNKRYPMIPVAIAPVGSVPAVATVDPLATTAFPPSDPMRN